MRVTGPVEEGSFLSPSHANRSFCRQSASRGLTSPSCCHALNTFVATHRPDKTIVAAHKLDNSGEIPTTVWVHIIHHLELLWLARQTARTDGLAQQMAD